MSNILPKAPSKRTIILAVITFIVLVLYLVSLLFYPNVAIHIAIPVLFLWLTGLHLNQGIEKMQNKGNSRRWYKQHNIIMAIAFISGFMVFPFYYLLPLRGFIIFLQYFLVVLPAFCMLLLLLYAFILYHGRNDDIAPTRDDESLMN